jgi:hypothetical protein
MPTSSEESCCFARATKGSFENTDTTSMEAEYLVSKRIKVSPI